MFECVRKLDYDGIYDSYDKHHQSFIKRVDLTTQEDFYYNTKEER